MSITTEAELTGMQQVSEAVATALKEMRHYAQPGMTTKELDEYGASILESFEFLFSCRDDEFGSPPSGYEDVHLCYRDSIWDKNKIRNSLLGTWQWEYITCVDSPGGATIDSNITIEFRPDSFLLLKKLNETIQTSKWEIVDGDYDYFAIDAEPSNKYLHGRIWICDDKAIFEAHYVDGCANHFRKQ